LSMAGFDIHNMLGAIDKTRIEAHEQAERQYQQEISAAWKLWHEANKQKDLFGFDKVMEA